MNDLGKYLVIAGLIIALIGAMIWTGFGRGWFGQLPGDIHIERDNFNFHFPLATCILISLVVTLFLWLLRR